MNPQPNVLPDRPSAIWLEPLEECRSLPLVLGIVGGVNAMVSVKKIPWRGGERHDREPCRFADQITRRHHRPRQVVISKNPRANHRRLGQAERHGEALGLRSGHGAVERVAHFAPKPRRRNLQVDRSGVHAGRLGQARRLGPTCVRLGHVGRSRGRPRKQRLANRICTHADRGIRRARCQRERGGELANRLGEHHRVIAAAKLEVGMQRRRW